MKSLRARVLMLVAGAGLLTAIVLAAVMHTSVRSYYTDVVYTQSLAFIDRVIEMHPDPKKALSDGSQALTPEQFSSLMAELKGLWPYVA